MESKVKKPIHLISLETDLSKHHVPWQNSEQLFRRYHPNIGETIPYQSIRTSELQNGISVNRSHLANKDDVMWKVIDNPGNPCDFEFVETAKATVVTFLEILITNSQAFKSKYTQKNYEFSLQPDAKRCNISHCLILINPMVCNNKDLIREIKVHLQSFSPD